MIPMPRPLLAAILAPPRSLLLLTPVSLASLRPAPLGVSAVAGSVGAGDRAVRLSTESGEGLAAHRAGLVHQRLTPHDRSESLLLLRHRYSCLSEYVDADYKSLTFRC